LLPVIDLLAVRQGLVVRQDLLARMAYQAQAQDHLELVVALVACRAEASLEVASWEACLVEACQMVVALLVAFLVEQSFLVEVAFLQETQEVAASQEVPQVVAFLAVALAEEEAPASL